MSFFQVAAALVVCFLVIGVHCNLQCLDNNGRVVDWYFVYKSNSGTKYSYYDSSSTASKLTPVTGQTLDAGSNSCVERTLNQIYNNKKGVNYFAYNDENPNGSYSLSCGHSKGVLAFDNTNSFKGGFWMIQAVPKFPNMALNSYAFASNGITYGQNFLCISMNSVATINLSARQIRYNSPYIYAHNQVNANNTASISDFNLAIQAKWLTGSNIVNLPSSSGTTTFTHITRSGSMNTDIFENLISTHYKASFQWETWLHTNPEPSYCTPKYHYDEENIKQVTLGDNWYINNGNDHSKYGIAIGAGTTPTKPIVCSGDLNRATSQNARGGGYACFENAHLYNAIKNIITEVDGC